MTETPKKSEPFEEQHPEQKIGAFRKLCESESHARVAAREWEHLWEGGDRRLREDEISQLRGITKIIRGRMKAIEEVADRFEKLNNL